MDVQLDNVEPPPGEAQPAGKIRKGFKLFGKRKPRSIFSLRRKGDENKSPIVRSKTLDGLTEASAAPDSEQVPAQEKESEEVSRAGKGEGEGEGEPLGKDGVLAAAPPRHSISSTASAKSLGFLSLLRGGRRGAGDRRVHTVSQPVGRHRRGLRGLFAGVTFRQKEREDKDEAPPSPLLMSSRTNSVEIIKEDLTLTPRPQPRSVDGLDTGACEPEAGAAPQAATGNVSRADEHAPPLPTTEPPMEPGDSSLSSLLADISSLLTFDSISGGGDIMADVEAEWGKASAAISAMGTGGRSPLSSPSKPVSSSPLTSPSSISVTSATKSFPLPSFATFSTQPFTSTTKPAISSSPIPNPSPITTFSTKSYTLAIPSLKSGSDVVSKAPATEATKMTTFIKSPPPTATTKPAPMTSTSFSPPLMPCPLITKKSTPYSTSVGTAASQPPDAVVKSSSISPTLTSTAAKTTPENTLNIAPASIPSSVSKAAPVTSSPPTPVAFSIPLSAKLDSTNTSSSQKTFQSSIAGAPNAPASTSVASTVQIKSSSSAPVVTSKMSVVPTPATAPLSSSATLSSPTRPPDPTALGKDNSVLASTPDPTRNKPQPSLPTIQTSSTILQSPVMPQHSPPPIQTSSTILQSPVIPQHSPPPIQTSSTALQSSVKPKPSPPPFQMSASLLVTSVKPQPTPAPIQTSAPSPVSSVKLQPTLGPIQTSSPTPVSSVKIQHTPAPISTITPVQDRVSTTSTFTPLSASLDKNPPTAMPTTISKVAVPAQTLSPCLPNTIPSPIPPSTASIPNSLSKTPAAVVPDTRHAFSSPPIPAPLLGEALTSDRIQDGIQSSVDGRLTSPSAINAKGPQTISQKREEPQTHANLQGHSKDKRTPPTKSGLSKIPVVGGGKAGKLPVRENQHADEEVSSDPPTPVLEEERPRLGLQSRGSKDKICDIEAGVHPSKHTQEESQRLQQPKVASSAPRDSKIPVKHGAHSHNPQTKEAPRTKIPVSKVPIRRTGNKPAAAGTGIPIRK